MRGVGLTALCVLAVASAPGAANGQEAGGSDGGVAGRLAGVTVTTELALGRYTDVEYSNLGEAASVAAQVEVPLAGGLGLTVDGALWHFGVGCVGASPCGETGVSGLAGLRFTPAGDGPLRPYVGGGAGPVRWNHGGVGVAWAVRAGLELGLGRRTAARLEGRYQPIRGRARTDAFGERWVETDRLFMLGLGLRIGSGG